MRQLFDVLSQSWVGSILGILGIVAAVIFYLRSRRIARLSFQSDEVAIIGGSGAAFPEEVTIHFADSPVPRVTATRFVIWNSGNTTLNGNQIVQSDPLRLELEREGKVLKADLLRVSRQVNSVWVRPRDGAACIVDIGFDYMDSNDGFAVEILHSGGRADLRLNGTLRGLPGGITDCGRAWYFDRRLRDFPFPFRKLITKSIPIMLCFGIFATGFALLLPYLYMWFPSLAEKLAEPKVSDPLRVRWPILFIGLTYVILPLLLIWVKRRRYPTCLEPIAKINNTEQLHPADAG